MVIKNKIVSTNFGHTYFMTIIIANYVKACIKFLDFNKYKNKNIV